MGGTPRPVQRTNRRWPQKSPAAWRGRKGRPQQRTHGIPRNGLRQNRASTRSTQGAVARPVISSTNQILAISVTYQKVELLLYGICDASPVSETVWVWGSGSFARGDSLLVAP